ncbi:hypothetical protein Q5752_003582 [Cryptotrichosporon argae]
MLARPARLVAKHVLSPAAYLRASAVRPAPFRLPTSLGRFVSDRPAPADRPPRTARPSTNPLASHKPPKRRLEAASLPLRDQSTPTRGPILQCIAHTTAERYDLVRLGLALRSLGVAWNEVPEGDRERAFVIGPWKGRGGAERLISGKDVRRTAGAAVGGAVEAEDADDERDVGFHEGERGEIWVFSSGSIVTWGLTEEEGRAFLREVVRGAKYRIEVDPLPASQCEVEEVDFVVDPQAKTRILGNLILLGRPPVLATFPHSPSLASLLARYTLSLSLTRSSSLSVLESRLDRHIASVSSLPAALQLHGRQPLGRRDVIRKIGELMVLRMAVNTRGGGLEETPEFYWSEPDLEAYFDAVASEFEIKERIDTVNKKIDYAQEVQSTLRALLVETSSHRLEIIIIALIAVEVVIVLIREGPELAHRFAYPVIDFFLDILQPSRAEERRRDRAEAAPEAKVPERPPPLGVFAPLVTETLSDRRLV